MTVTYVPPATVTDVPPATVTDVRPATVSGPPDVASGNRGEKPLTVADPAGLRPLDDFLPVFEFSERHLIHVAASPARIDEAVRAVSIADIPLARVLWWLRRLGRPYGDATKPFVGGELPGVVLDDVPGGGIVLGLTGQFWRMRGGQRDPRRPVTAEEFLAYDRGDTCKAVIDFRIASGTLSTETRVHVGDPASRRTFRRYWLVIRPFSGLVRILLLRAARRRAEAPA